MTKFKQLTKKEQIEHIWEYYKWHIIGSIFGVVLITHLLITIFGPKPPKPATNIVIMGKYIQEEEKVFDFKQGIQSILDEETKGQVEINDFPVDWAESSPLTMAMEQKLLLMFQAKEIDILVIEKEKFDAYLQYNEESPFEALDTEELLIPILENNKDKLIKHKFANSNKEQVYGLSVQGNPKLEGIGLNSDFIIAIPVVASNREYAVKCVEWIYK